MASLSFVPDQQDPFFIDCIVELRRKGVAYHTDVLFAAYSLAYTHVSHAAQYQVFWDHLKDLEEIDLAIPKSSFYTQVLVYFRGAIPRETAQRNIALLTMTLTKEFRIVMNLFFNGIINRLKTEVSQSPVPRLEMVG